MPDLIEEYRSRDALGLAELVRDGEASPEELLEVALAERDRVNPVVNAVCADMEPEAREQLRQGLPEQAPFRGVPFLLKDLRAQYAGVPTTAGSRFFADAVAPHDSELVRRQKRAGLVIFGKTSSPEFGCNVSTEPVLFGPTRNPWDTSRIAGGSSGGASAAVASGIVPAAHASDGGGSIRIPASCCGLFGLKPTRGRNPAGPDFGEAWSGLSMEHAITRSVRDSAALLDATAGPDVGDPYWAPPQSRPYLDEVTTDPGRIRIAFSAVAPSGAPVDPDCIAALESAVRLCEELGHQVEEAVPDYDGTALGDAVRLIIGANVKAAIDERAAAIGREPGPEDLERVIVHRAALGDRATATQYASALRTMHHVGRRVGGFFEQYDVLLSPTLAKPPQLLGVFDTNTDDVQAFLGALWGFIPFTALANATGQPAMSVPLHWNDEGLPIGVHALGRFGDEATLFRLAGQLERARPWAHLRAPITQGVVG